MHVLLEWLHQCWKIGQDMTLKSIHNFRYPQGGGGTQQIPGHACIQKYLLSFVTSRSSDGNI